MPTCVAILKTRPGEVCGCQSHYTRVRNLCGTHHNSAMKNDVAYRDAYRAAYGPAPAPYQAAADAVAAEAAAAAAAELRANRIALNERKLAESRLSPAITDIMRYTRRLIAIWCDENIADLDMLKAYIILRYHSIVKPHFTDVLEATVRITLQANGFHPDHKEYRTVPLDERTNAINKLREAIALFTTEEVNIQILANQSDSAWPRIQEHMRALEQRAAAARREAERQAFEQRLRQEQVVFRRDPEGGIDLRAFGNDVQSVHRSSVQTATEQAVHILLLREIPAGQETLVDIFQAFNNSKMVKWSSATTKEAVVTEITNDYFNTEAFSIRYGLVLDHVWHTINTHKHMKSLCVRLAQEITDGIKQCSNGKMARLINVLRGFDEQVDEVPPPEALRLMFQNKIARLMERPLGERKQAAEALFQEYNISAEEQEAWLSPLLE